MVISFGKTILWGLHENGQINYKFCIKLLTFPNNNKTHPKNIDERKKKINILIYFILLCGFILGLS